MEKITLETSKGSCPVFFSPGAELLLIQPADTNELPLLEREAELIAERTETSFAFAAFPVADWNAELSPWEAPPVFGKTPFGSGAAETLAFIENEFIPACMKALGLPREAKTTVGGYSLAALFALWCAYSSGRFCAAAAASPSVWFPGWIEFINGRKPNADFVYLSLGNREKITKNPTMRRVEENLIRQSELLASAGTPFRLEWNEGGHFSEPEMRTAKAFAACVAALAE